MLEESYVYPQISVFSDSDHYEEIKTQYPEDQIYLLSDPIKDTSGGTLTFHEMNTAFSGSSPIKSYEFIVDGQLYKASKLDAAGDASFKLPKMTSGDKVGQIYVTTASGFRSSPILVVFDVDDKTAPVFNSKMAVMQSGNDFNLSWAPAIDDSAFTYSLVVKDGKNVVYSTEIDGSETSLSVSLSDMEPINGKSLSFELTAQQETTEHGQPVMLYSKTAKASASLKDTSSPRSLVSAFTDSDHYEEVVATYGDNVDVVSDPINDNKGGTLTLHGIGDAFDDNVKVTSYELVVDGQVFKASKLDAAGDASFKLPKMTSGDKVGQVYALDAAGNRSEAVSVFFDVDDKTAPVLNGKLSVVQSDGDFFDISWTPAVDDNAFKYFLVVKNGKEVIDEFYIDGGNNYCWISVDSTKLLGKSLSFELTAQQETTEHGQPVTLSSKTLKASAKVVDMTPPVLVSEMILSDFDHAEAAELDLNEYLQVSDPIHNGAGTLGLYDVDTLFVDNVGIKSYQLVVDGKSFDAAAAKMSTDGDSTLLNFNLSGLSIGDKEGFLYALDAAGNRSIEGVPVFFDVDNKKY